MTIKQEIINKFQQNKGFLCSDDIINSAQRYHISKMLQSNEISRIKKGVYLLNNHEYFDERVLISKMFPKSVFCLFSAWEYYQLSTTIPTRHYLSLCRNTKVNKSSYPPIQIHYWSDVFFNLGITEITIDNNKIRIYDIERSVCDAVRYRAKAGEDITIEVVKNYIQNKNRNLDKLMKYAHALRINKKVEQYIKPLL